MKGESRIRTLILTLVYPHKASYYDDWLDAFFEHPEFDCSIENILKAKPSELEKSIDRWDAIIVMHAATADSVEDLMRIAPSLAQRNKAKLFAFVGNEYNSAVAPIADKITTLGAIRPDVVATQLLKEAGDFLYQGCGAQTLSVPHGLNPKIFRPGPPHSSRGIDIGARSFRYPASIGDNDRNRLFEYFQVEAKRLDLVVDIDQVRRFGRDDWAKFLRSSRGTVSTEAGSWYLDRDDSLALKVHEHISKSKTILTLSARNPLRRLVRLLPNTIKESLAKVLRGGPVGYEGFEPRDIDFAEVYEKFFREAKKAPVYTKAVSSRHFDAIGSKTSQIMIEGRFNDVLEPNKHYFALKADLSNVDDVIQRFRDDRQRDLVTEQAYSHVMERHTLQHRLTSIANVLRA